MNNNINLKFKASADGVKKSAESVKQSLTKVGRNTKQTEEKFAKLYKQTKKNNEAFSNLTKDANRTNKSLSTLNKGLGSVTKSFALQTVSVYALSKALGSAISSCMDMIETANLFNVAMGDTAVSTQKSVEKISNAFGLDQTNIQSAIGTYALLARSMGVTSTNAQTLSVNTQKLALDLSSLTNVPINQVMQDLRSGLLGQSETVYKYGIDVTEASLKQEALAQGITKSVRNMSQGEKLMLRYSVMLKQTGLAHGDFAKTIETPANQLRILSERLVTLARAFGSLFEPALRKILPYLNAVTIVLTKIIKQLALLLGYEPPEIKDMTNGFSGITDDAENAEEAVDGVTKAVNKLNNAMSFDELNVLSDDTANSSSGTNDAGVGSFDITLEGYDNLMDGVNQKANQIAESIEKAIQRIKDQLLPLNKISFDKLNGSLSKIRENLSLIGIELFNGLIWGYNNVFVPIANWTTNEVLPSFLEAFGNELSLLYQIIEVAKPSLEWVWTNFLVPIGQWTGDVVVSAIDSISSSFEKLSNVISGNTSFTEWIESLNGKEIAITSIVSAIATLLAILTPLATISKIVLTVTTLLSNPIVLVVGGIALLIAGIILLVQHLDDVKAFLNDIKDKITECLDTNETFKFSIDTITETARKLVEQFSWVGDIFNLIIDIIKDLCGILVEFFNEYAEPIFKGIISTIKNIWDIISKLYTVVIKPVIENIIRNLQTLWERAIKPLVSNILKLGGDLIEFILALFNNVIKPIFDKIVTYILPVIVDAVKFAINICCDLINSVISFINGIVEVLRGLLKFLTGVFTGDWKKAWEGVKLIFKGVFDSLVGIAKFPINCIISLCESMINTIIKGLNKVINLMNNLSFDVPDWIPVIGGSTFGFNLKTISELQLPRLARGGSLEKGQLFEAGEFGKAELVGSYNNKTTVMPLENSGFIEAIYNAVKDAIIETSGDEQVINVTTNLDGEVIYTNQQKIANGRGVNLNMGVFAR